MKQIVIASIFVHAAGGKAGARVKYRTNTTIELDESRTGNKEMASGMIKFTLSSWSGKRALGYSKKSS